MASATKIFGFGLVAAMIAGCGSPATSGDPRGNATDTHPGETDSVIIPAEVVDGGKQPECAPNTLFCDPDRPTAVMKCTGEGKAEAVTVCPAGQICREGACVIADTDGAEGTTDHDAGPEGAEGKIEGVEGFEGFEGIEGTEGAEVTVEGGEGDGGAEGMEAGAEGGETCEPECAGNTCCEGGACVEGECDPTTFKPECDTADNTVYKVCEACKFKFMPCNPFHMCVDGTCIHVDYCKLEQNTCKDKATASVCDETAGWWVDKPCDPGTMCVDGTCIHVDYCPATACGGDATMAQGPGCRYCIDKFEASVWDAPCAGVPAAGIQYGAAKDDYPGSFPDTAAGGGSAACAAPVTAPLYACSVPGVVPSRFITACQVEAACAAVGKRLCKVEEWRDACDGFKGTGGGNFPYGATYDDSFCATSALSMRTEPEATQAMSNCKTPSGIYDLVGNAAELVKNVAAGDKIQPAGADYSTNAQKAPTATRCDADVSISLPGTFAGNPIMGFRCCKDEVPGP